MVTGFVDRAKGKTAIGTQFQQQNSAFYTSAQDGVTATPSSTQANALLLQNQQTRITTAAVGSGVRLPPAIQGAQVVVVNDGASTTLVWPSSATQGGVAGGDAISPGAANASFSLTVALGPTIFFCFTTGIWRTK